MQGSVTDTFVGVSNIAGALYVSVLFLGMIDVRQNRSLAQAFHACSIASDLLLLPCCCYIAAHPLLQGSTS